jgi:hypothetical protein
MRQRQTVGHGAVKQVEVGAADAAVGDPNLHLARTRFHGHTFTQAQRAIAFKEYGLHD